MHMYQEQPFCAQLWYQTHLNVAVPAPRAGPGSRAPRRTAASSADPTRRCRRSIGTACSGRRPCEHDVFGDVSLYLYMNQGGTPAGPTRGHLMDHYARQRRRSRRVDREAEERERHVPRAALHDRRFARVDDRRPEQGSDRDRRSEITALTSLPRGDIFASASICSGFSRLPNAGITDGSPIIASGSSMKAWISFSAGAARRASGRGRPCRPRRRCGGTPRRSRHT